MLPREQVSQGKRAHAGKRCLLDLAIKEFAALDAHFQDTSKSLALYASLKGKTTWWLERRRLAPFELRTVETKLLAVQLQFRVLVNHYDEAL